MKLDAIKKLVRDKADNLRLIPEQFLSSVEKSQRDVLAKLIDLLNNLETKGGFVVQSKRNLLIADEINSDLEQIFTSGEYIQAVTDFAASFDEQKKVTDKYFSAAFPDFKPSDFADTVFENAQRNAVDLLANSTVKTEFLQGLRTQIDMIVSSGASWNEARQFLQDYAIGDGDVDGKLLKYAKEVAYDSIAVADRAYTSAVADELGSEWFLFTGGIIATSREFCRERDGRYFYYKEIEAWAELDWSGKNQDQTNASTIYTLLGGWNCEHSLIPVPIEMVPQDDIDRATEAGFYEPPAE